MKSCNHIFHETLDVDTAVGKMQVFDYKKYRKKGCPATEKISRELKKRGVWEQEETDLLDNLLDKHKAKRKLFIDVGAGIGWYTLLAAKYKFDVVSFEPNISKRTLLCINADMSEEFDFIHVSDLEINDDIKPATLGKPYREIFMVRIGSEKDNALKMFDKLLTKNKIRHVYIKPENRHKKLLMSYGYTQNGNLFTRAK